MKEESFLASHIRQTARNRKRYYSVIDIVAGVTGSKNPRDYWYRVKKRRETESNVDLSTLCRRLRLPGPDGKRYFTDCVDRDGISLILKQLPAKVSCQLLRRNKYTLEDLQKHLLKRRKDEQKKATARSCRQIAESDALSDELWLRLHRFVHPILKELYCTPEPANLRPWDKEGGTQPRDPAESYNISSGAGQADTDERTPEGVVDRPKTQNRRFSDGKGASR